MNDTTRHLLDIAIGAFPGLAPLVNEDLIPLKCIQHALSYLYGLKKHIPTLIGSEYFDYQAGRPVYYSLQYPITRAFSPKNKNSISMLTHLGELKAIMERFLKEITKQDSMWYETILQDAARAIKIDYIHNNHSNKVNPTSPQKVVEIDSRFLFAMNGCIKNNDLPATDANFFRGCVGLMRTGL